MNSLLFLNENDNIAVCLEDLKSGTQISQSGFEFEVKNNIPRGHKIATKNIKKDDGIIKYGERMGHATVDIQTGEHVHVHNVLGDRLSSEQVK
jgi:altronate dehydratase